MTGAAGGLARVLEQTASLHRLVAGGAWQAAAEVEAERRGLLEQFFAVPPPAAELPAILAQLRPLIEANERLIELGAQLRRRTAQESQQATMGRRAVRAYAGQAG